MLRLKNSKGIKHFQGAHGLKVTGHLDAATSQKVRVHNRNAQTTHTSSAPAKKPVDPLTKAANAQANADYAPKIKTAQDQINVSGAQLQNTGNWYQDYLNKVQQAQQTTADAYSNAENSLIRQGAQTDTADRAASNALTEKMAADAASRGGTVDPGVQATANQAASSRQAALGTLLANVGGQGGAATQAFGDRGVVAAGAKAQALTAETNRGRALQTALGDLKSQRSQQAQVYRGQLAKDQLTNAIAEQGLGIKVKQLGINQQNTNNATKATNSLVNNRTKTLRQTKAHQGKQDSLAGKKFANAQAKDAYQRAHHLGPYKPAAGTKPKAESQSSLNFKHKVDTYTSNIKRLRAGGLTPAEAGSAQGKALGFKAGQKLSGPQISAWARSHGADDVALNIARDLVYVGHVSQRSIAEARGSGVRIPKQWRNRGARPSVSGIAQQVAGLLP